MNMLNPLQVLAASLGDDALDVADVFSTDLWTGNGTSQSITNGVDLSGEGGLVWVKRRDNANNHFLTDTVRGSNKQLLSSATNAELTDSNRITAFNTDGFDIGSEGNFNQSSATYVGWSFRKAAKFFDVVTYTGDANSATVIPHSLGVKPGHIVVKRLDGAEAWVSWARVDDTTVVRRSSTVSPFGFSSTNAGTVTATSSTVNAANDTNFSPYDMVGGSNTLINESGHEYVAYLFAHDTSSSGIIQCGSYTGNGSATGPTVTLGWEPQWLLVKNAAAAGGWVIWDNQRSPSNPVNDSIYADTSDAEVVDGGLSIDFLSTGFQIKNNIGIDNGSGNTIIYAAIRAEGA